MGTEDLKEKFLYSAYIAEILKLIHDCEEKAMKREIDTSGKEKKEWVINKIHIKIHFNIATILKSKVAKKTSLK